MSEQESRYRITIKMSDLRYAIKEYMGIGCMFRYKTGIYLDKYDRESKQYKDEVTYDKAFADVWITNEHKFREISTEIPFFNGYKSIQEMNELVFENVNKETLNEFADSPLKMEVKQTRY